MGGKGGDSARVALSWQLSYDKAGQGSRAPRRKLRKAILRPLPSGRFNESEYRKSSLTFPTTHAREKGVEVGALPAAVSFLVLTKSAYAALEWQMAEEAFSGSKRAVPQ